MKKILMTIGLGVAILSIGVVGSAHEVHETADNPLSIEEMTINNEATFEVIYGKQARAGFRWKCKTKGYGYVNSWHLLNSTASQYVMAHHMKYGHSVVVYSV